MIEKTNYNGTPSNLNKNIIIYFWQQGWTWRTNIMLSKINQAQKKTNIAISHLRTESKIIEFTEAENAVAL